ncbi:hypothetical protein CHKEEEPN_3045 [Methylorubrum podarium]|jgi:(S)-ureidoglycine aminohydrolase|nr:hypothetical protein CHKEEEPN_3045 [Methylorubrum podarium]
MRDIVMSPFPFRGKTRARVLARPMTGFSETFCHGLTETGPEAGAEAVLFVVDGAPWRIAGEANSA